MMQIEDIFFDLVNICEQNCLFICDRGFMDVLVCMYNVKVFQDNMELYLVEIKFLIILIVRVILIRV